MGDESGQARTRGVMESVVRRFAAACAAEDQEAVREVLAADVVLVSDGGGRVLAPLRPIRGAIEAARIVVTLMSAAVLSIEEINGRPGVVLRRGGRVEAVASLEVTGSVITRIWVVLNPDKLAHWLVSDPSRG
ncbi:hypothetical protein ACIBG5_00470 [Kribbella sp. NPDC050241]|uniref:hypothetical protein n=2 Tax=unclassified Kribbella TaxID=2644121 RepID=UPI0037B12161